MEQRIHVWRRREIENYLLDENAIFNVIQNSQAFRSMEGHTFRNVNDVRDALRASADETKDSVIAKKIEHELHSLFRPIRLEPDDIHYSFSCAIDRRTRIFELQHEGERQRIIEMKEREVEDRWDDDWKAECLGKETLERFIVKYFQGSMKTLYPIFIEDICRSMREADAVPEEIRVVLSMIV